MKIERCTKDKKCHIPTVCVVPDSDGWTFSEPPEDGVIITASDAKERTAGGGFISDQTLAQYGYERKERVGELLALIAMLAAGVRKDDLQKAIIILGGPKLKTKRDMVEWLTT